MGLRPQRCCYISHCASTNIKFLLLLALATWATHLLHEWKEDKCWQSAIHVRSVDWLRLESVRATDWQALLCSLEVPDLLSPVLLITFIALLKFLSIGQSAQNLVLQIAPKSFCTGSVFVNTFGLKMLTEVSMSGLFVTKPLNSCDLHTQTWSYVPRLP